MRKKIIYSITVLMMISVLPVSAKEGIYGSAGTSLIKSKDDNISRQYYKPFAVIGWAGSYIDISASYNRWMSYSITDALYNIKEINIDQPGAVVTIYAGDILNLSGGYSYFKGDSSYAAHKITGEITLNFERVEISADSSLKNTEYDFNGTIENSAITAGGEISIDVTDNFSFDLGYQHEYTDYKTYGYTYTKNSGRIGFVAVPMKSLFFLGGVTGGNDSDKVKFAAVDAGLTLKIFEHLKLSGAYMLTADFISSDSTVSGKKGSSSATTSTETEISHTGYVSVSLYF
jgi:opacity protein-like surface antigen